MTLLASVRDRDGKIVKDLSRDDFTLKDDGREQEITHFSKESDLPLKIGLLVDTSRSQIGVLEAERTASYQFLDQVLREGTDMAFVAHFDIKVGVDQEFTSSLKKLSAALGRLRIPGRASTLLFAAIKDTAEHQMRKQKGRKAFIVLSDGVSVRDKATISTAIEFAQRADTIIYSILFRANHPRLQAVLGARMGMGAQRGRNAMQRLARETGGAFYEVTEEQTIEMTYKAIEDTLRTQYSIGYTPNPAGQAGQFHKIELKAKQAGLLVTARDGYYAE